MKKFIIMAAIVALAGTAYGASSMVGTSDGKNVYQGFAPRSDYSKTLTLGTKGFGNYSTVGKGAIRFTCRNTGTNSLTAVKTFLNGVETNFLTLDAATIIINDNATAPTTYVRFGAYSSSTSVSCGIFGM